MIATPWGRATCRQFTTLLAESPGDPMPPIRWVRLDRWDDPAHLLDAGRTVHLLLGWPTATLQELGDRNLLDESEDAPFRCLGLEGAESFPMSDADRRFSAILPGDPRIDPVARDQVARQLAWAEGRDADLSLLELGASFIPGSVDSPSIDPDTRGFSVASIAAPSNSGVQALLDRLRRGSLIEPLPIQTPSPERTLAAELIGATILDAGPELRRAFQAIEQSPNPQLGRAVLAEPPPWPPDSIQRLTTNDPSSRSMIETLAEALVDDPESRAWLLDSWQTPPRPVDRALLDALATANDGRLLQSSRVLPWLRAEWTAWARQRFSQLARELAAEAEEAAR
ncbi:hypothetical protein [Tautonia marina]|uniref:hypothetical protein n=1 Tax=Tautonia marina TaxID=2653855 RepID=UPI00126118AE|nr:hypothetical protein [Tautonia marina]